MTLKSEEKVQPSKQTCSESSLAPLHDDSLGACGTGNGTETTCYFFDGEGPFEVSSDGKMKIACTAGCELKGEYEMVPARTDIRLPEKCHRIPDPHRS